MKNVLHVLILVLFVLQANAISAKEVPVQGRIFFGSTKIDPIDANDEFTSIGFQKMESVTQYGAEALFPLTSFLDFGLRYARKMADSEELVKTAGRDYSIKLNQDVVAAVLRIPFLKTDILRMDVFGGYGGSNTTVKVKTSAQVGELTRKDSEGWFAAPYSLYGASVGVGFKKFFLYVEGGAEDNKVRKFKRTGTVNNNIEEVNLSGSYFVVGFLFDGLSGSKK